MVLTNGSIFIVNGILVLHDEHWPIFEFFSSFRVVFSTAGETGKMGQCQLVPGTFLAWETRWANKVDRTPKMAAAYADPLRGCIQCTALNMMISHAAMR